MLARNHNKFIITIEMTPKLIECYQLARKYRTIAYRYFLLAKFEKSLRAYRRASFIENLLYAEGYVLETVHRHSLANYYAIYAEIYSQTHQEAKALVEIHKAIANLKLLGSDDPVYKTELGGYYLFVGSICYSQQKYTQAIDNLQFVIQELSVIPKNKLSTEDYSLLGQAYFWLGKCEHKSQQHSKSFEYLFLSINNLLLSGDAEILSKLEKTYKVLKHYSKQEGVIREFFQFVLDLFLFSTADHRLLIRFDDFYNLFSTKTPKNPLEINFLYQFMRVVQAIYKHRSFPENAFKAYLGNKTVRDAFQQKLSDLFIELEVDLVGNPVVPPVNISSFSPSLEPGARQGFVQHSMFKVADLK